MVFVACVCLGLCHIRDHACNYVFGRSPPSLSSVNSEFTVTLVFTVSEHISSLK